MCVDFVTSESSISHNISKQKYNAGKYLKVSCDKNNGLL